MFAILGAILGVGVLGYSATRYAEVRSVEQNKLLSAVYEAQRDLNESLACIMEELSSIERIEVSHGGSAEKGSDADKKEKGQGETGSY